ncbi:MAG: DUF3299 domain-containing protein [Kordiimonadaceae bacterium]|nr:DUF3299 domain-containing protein [Kordiimonadaceae bacterium]MBO6569311.1 DUF3299 domain-containing protein [Kordiimonadaceae bacterium]MBO6964787.1 DUF3299 domain-containing protein [Kordiimonadaceae bacterium]
MRLFVFSLLMIFSLSTAGSARQSTFWEQEIPDLEDDLGQIWRPAPAPPGALDWSILMNIVVEEELVDNFIQYVPSFTSLVQSFDDKTIKLNGYMVPLEATEEQSHFILMAYPHACPFHMPGGPAAYVEIQADFPVKFTYDPVLVEGHFQILEDFSGGVFYRISAARQVTNEN